VMGQMTIKEIAAQKKCSSRNVHRLFKNYLDHPPTPQIRPNNDCRLMIDGTYFGDICLLNYFDNDLKRLQYFEIVRDENYLDFRLGLELLKKVGLNIKIITSDGDRALIMAINEVLPDICHQLFHYLDNPKIPKLTNGLECRFSYLKNNPRAHRGLSKEHRKSFLLWYDWFKYNN